MQTYFSTVGPRLAVTCPSGRDCASQIPIPHCVVQVRDMSLECRDEAIIYAISLLEHQELGQLR
jgi:hypothetical protein